MNQQQKELNLEEVLESWPAEQAELKDVFIELKAHAKRLPNTVSCFISRPGISHSLRFNLKDGEAQRRKRTVFLLMDIISDADLYFLSICFYADEITDPKELGDAIPEGLSGETGYCFDVEENDPALTAYIKERITEANQNALKN